LFLLLNLKTFSILSIYVMQKGSNYFYFVQYQGCFRSGEFLKSD
jgi:hypothetical protein